MKRMKLSILVLFIFFPLSNVESTNLDHQSMGKFYALETNQRKHSDSIESIPKSLKPALSKAFGRDNPLYHLSKAQRGYFQTETPEHRFSTEFTKEGIVVSPSGENQAEWQIDMALTSYGYGEKVIPVNRVNPKGSMNRIEYSMHNITEWYTNSPMGLEQGFTINEKPFYNEKGKDLVLKLKTKSELKPELTGDSKGVEWIDKNGDRVFSYSGLYTFDSEGKELPSDIVLKNGEINIEVNDAGAIYPITIDPTFQEIKKLTASDGRQGAQFGWSVSISGDTAIVAAILDNDNGIGSGSVYIFERNLGGAANWGEVRKLIASDGAAVDEFGFAVSISGDTAIVGAPGNNDDGTDSGSAYIFERDFGGSDRWGEVKKLTASDGEQGGEFGYSVSLSGDTAIIGARLDDGNGDDSGSAYIFERDFGEPGNWGEVKKLAPSDGAADDQFGYSVSINVDSVAVGGIGDNDNGAFSGSAYIFERDFGGTGNWGEVKKLTASDGAVFDQFGWSIGISGDTVIVGARLDNDNGRDSGSAYIFEKDFGGTDNWGEIKKLTASDGAANDLFAWSVGISGDSAVVGAIGNSDNGFNSGSAYIFQRDFGGADNWGEVEKLTASDAAVFDQFGISVGISGDTAIVGARFDNDKGSNSGSAYIYGELITPVCGNNIVEVGEDCDLGDGVNGTAGSCCSASCTFESAATQCRASAGVCDVAETCTGSSDTCPADGFAASGECRASAGICDVAETCNGSGPDCPVDLYALGGECRAAAGVCDVAESCNGSGPDCPVNGFQVGGECRPSAGSCDVAEVCSGSGPDCPVDAFAPGSQECRASAGVCDVAESCTGSSAACPADAKQNTNYECRASVDVCDVAEFCDGSTNDCPANALEPSGTVCRASAGSCDIAEECTGDASACPADVFEPDTTECRASAGVCDVAESCTGTGTVCPADGFEPDTTSCRAAVNSCDVEEFCSGSGVECPEDTMMDEGSTCTADNGGPDGQCLRDPLVCVNEGMITIIKVADTPDEEDGTDFEFSCTDSTTAACAGMGDENGMFKLDDPVIDDLDLVTDTETSDPMFVGEYTIEEMVPAGWQLDLIECIDDEDGETIANADAANVLIDLDPDEEVMCTFYNSNIPITIDGFNNSRLQVIKNRHNRVKIEGVTPGGIVKLAWGFRKGVSFVKNGLCSGTEFSIRNHKVIATLRANDQGNLNKTFFVPSTSATMAFFQPLDMASCTVGARIQVTLLND